MLQKGSNGDDVKNLQQRLIMEGYNCGSSGADGDFGDGTYDAVIRFQQEVGLTADGIVGDETWNALIAVTGDGSNPYLLKLGDTGYRVKSLQEKLIARGYDVGASGADGDFGNGTYNAVCNFQRDHGLDVDGVAGSNTFAAINGSVSTTILRLGSKGALVTELQEKLIARGYSCGASGADGDFGNGTYNAVISFQTANGLSADGIVGPMTWDALNGLQYNTLLRLGSKGSAVTELQQKLIAKGYDVGSTGADGDFGYGTYKAVCRFQEDHGLEVDGVVGPATWSVLNSSSYGNYSGELLQLGSKGESVRVLQTMLIGLGYSCGASGADGDFGNGTYSAVCNFQRDHGLDVDGVVGPATWNALNKAIGGTPPGGSKGVKKFLDIAIAQLGYREQYYNINKYGAWYGMNGESWCAMFVSWCANQAGILGSLVPSYSWCESGKNWYIAKGRYRTRTSGYVPLPGDVIFFYRNGSYYHTGIVEYVSGGTVHTIEGNAGDNDEYVIRDSYDINASNIDGYGLNGGIIPDKDEVLKEAGKIGLFKDHPMSPPGFSQEFLISILSLNPQITILGKISYQPTLLNGQIYQVGTTSAKGITTTITNGLAGAGIDFDFNEENILNTFESLNLSLTAGDVLKFNLAVKAYNVIEITIEYKAKPLNEDVYQSIIVRIEKGGLQPVRLPLVVTEIDYGRIETSHADTILFSVGLLGLWALGTGFAAGTTALANFFKSINFYRLPAFGR
jgi:peptidoglycan hydrolase-like protein with peptidoglycan-binding domain